MKLFIDFSSHNLANSLYLPIYWIKTYQTIYVKLWYDKVKVFYFVDRLMALI